jgi:hypothetical protein
MVVCGRDDVTGLLDLLPPSSLCLRLLITLPLPLPCPLSGQRWLPLPPLLPANLLNPLLCLRPVMDRMVLQNFHCLVSSISSMPNGSSTGTISSQTSSLLRKARQDSSFGLTFSPLSTHTSCSEPKRCCLPSALLQREKRSCLCLFWRF